MDANVCPIFMARLRQANSTSRLLLAWLAALSLLGCASCAPAAQSVRAFDLKPECVGRVQIDLPAVGVKHWTQTFDWAEVSRLPITSGNEAGFWRHVEERKRHFESLSHETEPNRLGVYEPIGKNAAILLYRPSAVADAGYDMERFLWLGTWGYVFNTKAIANDEKSKLGPYTGVFSQMASVQQTKVDSPGFCIDGALVQGQATIEANVSVKLVEWKDVSLSIGVSERPASEQITSEGGPSQEIERERKAIAALKDETPGAASNPVFPKEFDVLREQKRALSGWSGEEVVFRKRLNNGTALYKFLWETTGLQGSSKHPSVSIVMKVGDQDKPQPQSSPDEQALLDLWDATLASLRPRPGAGE